MTKLQMQCWIVVIDALYWLIQNAIADRIGPNCSSPIAEPVFANLASVRYQLVQRQHTNKEI